MSFDVPLLLRPWLRPMPWGGRSLARHYPSLHFSEPIGEAWLLSQHALHDSVVEQGPFQGQSLGKLLEQYSNEIFGNTPLGAFPLLIKILDARENLSVQVHPNDEQARQWSPKERGKSEAWTVLESEDDGTLYIGLKEGLTIDDWRTNHSTMDIPSTLHQIRPSPGETYAIPPGTIHALGSGVVVLEVQQSSDATFRLYDWGRVGNDGKPRPLHIKAGLACLAEHAHAGLQSPAIQPNGSELLVRTPYFSLYRWQTNEAIIQAPAIVVPWNGTATHQSITVPHGQACLVPACLNNAAFQLTPGTMLFEIHWH
jgi:mannose-6-phosphate isomerase